MFAKNKVVLTLSVQNDDLHPEARSTTVQHCSISSQYIRMGVKRRRFSFCCFCCLLLLLLAMLAVAINTIGQKAGNNKKISITTQQGDHQQLLPICVGNLLDERTFSSSSGSYYFFSSNDDSVDQSGDIISRLMTSLRNPGGNHCRLMSYTSGQPIVTCLDALFHHHHELLAKNSTSRLADDDDEAAELIFVFIGDSRIRQQFVNFVKIIPNYDQVTQPDPVPLKYHGDIEVTSRILRLRVSFKWRPLVDGQLINTLNGIAEMASKDPRQGPHFILLSMAAWHMLREHGADFNLYKKRLALLGPILAKMLASPNIGRVIWLRQYTSVDFYGDNGKSNTLVVSEKIHHYNQVVHQFLLIRNDSSRIDLWDSSDPFANEYVRGCAILKRYEHLSFNNNEYAIAYANCNDYIHTGYSALSQATQLLYNELCNVHMLKNTR